MKLLEENVNRRPARLRAQQDPTSRAAMVGWRGRDPRSRASSGSRMRLLVLGGWGQLGTDLANVAEGGTS